MRFRLGPGDSRSCRGDRPAVIQALRGLPRTGTQVYSAYPPSKVRPMPPINAATCWPRANSPPGASATIPVASMPGPRGKVTPSARPSLVGSSERLSPNASTLIKTWPGCGVGIGRSRTCRRCVNHGRAVLPRTVSYSTMSSMTGMVLSVAADFPIVGPELLDDAGVSIRHSLSLR